MSGTSYPCGICFKECVTLSVECAKCIQWFHYECENLDRDQRLVIEKSPLDYVCSICCKDPKGCLDFQSSLERLSDAAGKNLVMLKKAVKMEKVFLRSYCQYKKSYDKVGGRKVDEVAVKYFQQCGGSKDRLPVFASGDGNCLFNSGSIATFGDESKACELRVLSCIELVEHGPYYAKLNKGSGIDLVSDDLCTAQILSPINGSYCSPWAMHAMATVLGVPIRSVYPPVNGCLDRTVAILNTTFQPRIQSKDQPIIILWTHVLLPGEGTWRPNHFVPLLPVVKNLSPVITLDTTMPEEKSYSDVVKGIKLDKNENVISSMQFSENENMDISEFDFARDEKLESTPKKMQRSQLCKGFDTSPVFSRKRKIDFSDLSPLPSPCKKSVTLSSQNDSSKSFKIITANVVPDIISDNLKDFSNESASLLLEAVNDVASNSHFNEPSVKGSFLDTDEVIDILFNKTSSISSIPRGKKEDVYIIINNDENVKRNQNGKVRKFVDDCGVYESGSIKTHYFVKDGDNFQYVDLKAGVFYETISRKRVVMEPQPTKDEIVRIRRLYNKLKRDVSFKRRITWVDQFPDSFKPKENLAVVEYVGTFPKSVSYHGNSKHSNEYIRTSTDVLNRIEEQVKVQQPREVYSKMTLDGSQCAPRDLKQVQNTKYIQAKTNRPTNVNSANNADDLQYLLTMLNSHPYLQEVVQVKGKPPCVIIYTDQQMEELKKFCVKDPTSKSILGVDRTFNLGPVYVTITVFQNYNLVRKSTNNAPIMLGPAYLHWDGSYETYHKFFSHLQSKLSTIVGTEISGTNLVFGSDEEKAMIKALHQCFPNADHKICSRHVEENVKRHLRSKIGLNDAGTKTIVNSMFGKNGLISSADDVSFDLRVLEIDGQIAKKIPEFKDYFQKSAELIKKFVWKPGNEQSGLWMNNACESMNHIIKLAANWKSLKLPQLVERLHDIVRLQYKDMRRALHGQGNYALAACARKLVVSNVVWEAKSEKEKNELFMKLLRFTTNKSKVVISTDGKLSIPKTPSTARKPGQKKRIRNAKTFSLIS